MQPQPDKLYPLLTEDEARAIIEPHRATIRQIFTECFEELMVVIKGKEHVFGPRSRASMLHDLIADKAASVFNSGEMHTRKVRGIFTVFFELADLRFKKVDPDGRSSNVRTNQNEAYSAQFKLPGFRALTRLSAGYVLNDVRTALERLLVVLQVGRKIEYVIDLNDATSQQGSLDIPMIPQSPAPPRRSRVKPKKDVVEVIRAARE